jgi:Asp-tRNA(Asn)/Glu-tRNA(Gln) amidotransferase A subunit family amidase
VNLRICFVTPFAWSQPHEVNAHVAGAAEALRARGHEVTVLAPSSRARDLLAGRRALQRGDDLDVIAVGPSVPLSRRTNMGVPVAVARISGSH